jgi:hypothetical protein
MVGHATSRVLGACMGLAGVIGDKGARAVVDPDKM